MGSFSRIYPLRPIEGMRTSLSRLPEINRGGSSIPTITFFAELFWGVGHDLSLLEWMTDAIWPLSRHLGRNESYLAALLSSVEMFGSGITPFVDSHYITRDKECYDGIAQAIEEIGIRGVTGRSTVDSDPTPPEFWEPADVAVLEAGWQSHLNSPLLERGNLKILDKTKPEQYPSGYRFSGQKD